MKVGNETNVAFSLLSISSDLLIAMLVLVLCQAASAADYLVAACDGPCNDVMDAPPEVASAILY